MWRTWRISSRAGTEQHDRLFGRRGPFELAYRPFRLVPVALILLLAATVMSERQQRLIALAFAVVGICFVAGAALQVLAHHPLY